MVARAKKGEANTEIENLGKNPTNIFKFVKFLQKDILNRHNPEWTPFEMDTIPNGHNPEWTQSQMDTISNVHHFE